MRRGKGVFAGRRGGGGRTPACYRAGFRADKSCEPDGGSVGVLCGMAQRVCSGTVRHIDVDRAARFLTDVPVCLRETKKGVPTIRFADSRLSMEKKCNSLFAFISGRTAIQALMLRRRLVA